MRSADSIDSQLERSFFYLEFLMAGKPISTCAMTYLNLSIEEVCAHEKQPLQTQSCSLMGSHPRLGKGDSWKFVSCNSTAKTLRLGFGKKNEEGAFAKRWNGNYLLWNPVQSSNEIFGKLLSILLIAVQKDPRLLFTMFPMFISILKIRGRS